MFYVLHKCVRCRLLLQLDLSQYMELIEDILDFFKKFPFRIDIQECGLVTRVMVLGYQVGINEKLVKGRCLTVRLLQR